MARKKTNGGTESPAEIAAKLIQEAASKGTSEYGQVLHASWAVLTSDAKMFPHMLKEFAKAVIEVIKKSELSKDSEGGMAQYLAGLALELAMQPTRYWRDRPSFLVKWESVGGESDNYVMEVGIYVDNTPAGRRYLWIDRGTATHRIEPKRARALRIRGYAPKTRPPDVTIEGKPYLYQRSTKEEPVGPLPWTARKYQRRKAELGSKWTSYYISPKILPRGYKGKYYTPAQIEEMPRGRRAKVSRFVASVERHSIAPRFFKEQIAEVMTARVQNEMARLAKELPEIFKDFVGKPVQCRVQVFGPKRKGW